jgi:hypothetical protein
MRIVVRALAFIAIATLCVSVPVDAFAKGSRSVLGHTRKDGTYVPPKSDSAAELRTHAKHRAPSRRHDPNSGGSGEEENIGHRERLERGTGKGAQRQAAPAY